MRIKLHEWTGKRLITLGIVRDAEYGNTRKTQHEVSGTDLHSPSFRLGGRLTYLGTTYKIREVYPHQDDDFFVSLVAA